MGDLVRVARQVAQGLTGGQLTAARTIVEILGEVLTDEADSRLV